MTSLFEKWLLPLLPGLKRRTPSLPGPEVPSVCKGPPGSVWCTAQFSEEYGSHQAGPKLEGWPSASEAAETTRGHWRFGSLRYRALRSGSPVPCTRHPGTCFTDMYIDPIIHNDRSLAANEMVPSIINQHWLVCVEAVWLMCIVWWKRWPTGSRTWISHL